MEPKIITLKAFIEKGESLFGTDKWKWKFKCPICENVQTAEDFKAIGAEPNAVDFNCIGRYLKEEVYKGFGENSKEFKKRKKNKPKGPCDYTSGGFFVINKIFYIGDDGKKFPTFEFAVDR